MLATADSLAGLAGDWLARLERAITIDAAAGDAATAALFAPESYWRDLVALTGRIGTVSGAQAIASALHARAQRARPSGFALDPRRTPPRRVTRSGEEVIEAIFGFETAAGRGSGVVRLRPAEGGAPKAWSLLTALESLKGLAPMQKAVFVKGLFAAVTHDGTILVMEAELMRMVGAVLDCPLPPLLESIDPATLVA